MTDHASPSGRTTEAPHPGRRERRPVTVLFADMVGFTATAERLGEEDAHELMQRIFALLARTVVENGGHVESFTGDGIMALFGVPVALEDATLRACKAALRIQERIAAAGPSLAAAFGVAPRLRIGINAGPIVSGRMADGRAAFSGDTVNLAARLQALAVPASVVLSEAAFQSVEGLVRAEFVGIHPVRGKSEAQRLYRLDAVFDDVNRFTAAIGRRLTAYVGRERERAVLVERLAEAAIGLALADVVGEAGIGKSRLLHEFLNKVDRATFAVMRGSCASDGAHVAYGLFVDLTRSAFRLVGTDDEGEIDRKIGVGLAALDLASAENLGLIRHLLGMRSADGVLAGLDGTLIGLRTRALMQLILDARCAASPVILVLEDLHWIDSVSEELLGKIIAASTALPLLVLHTRRPEYRPPWIEADSRATVSLAPLTADETETLVRRRLGATSLPPALAKLVMARSDGNALFAEEIASYLVERGALVRSGQSFELDEAAVAGGALPPNLQALLAARVDRLAPSDRVLLQAASVIGRSFDPDLLAVVTSGTNRLKASLDVAAGLDLLSFEPRSGDYGFKHALVRDALYDSLLSGPRAELHAKVGEAIERRSGNRLVEVAETLALHFSRTGRDDKAFAYLAMAGCKSLATYALAEAGRYFQQAESLLDRDAACASDDGFAGFMTGYVSFLHLTYEPKKIRETMEKYRRRTARLGDRTDIVAALHHEVWSLALLLRLHDAWTIQAEAENMAARLGEDRAFAYAEAGFFFLDAATCVPTPGIVRRGEAAVAAALRTGDLHVSAWLRFLVGWNAFHRGDVARARAVAAALSAAGLATRDPRSSGLASCLLCWTALVFDDLDEALVQAERALTTVVTPFDRVNAETGRATALALQRRLECMQPLAALRAEAVKHERLYEEVGNDMPYGIGLVLQGRFAEGVRQIETAIAKRDADYPIAADWYRLALSQLYLEILEGEGRPPLRVLLRNAPFLFCIQLTGRRKVLTLLRHAGENPTFVAGSFHTANLHHLLGRFYLLKRQRGAAWKHFTASKAILELHGASNMLRKTRSELARLETLASKPMGAEETSQES